MTIRTLQRHRCIAWLAVLAVLLVSIVPTISQVVLAGTPHTHASMSGAAHADHAGHALNRGDHDEECWHKCGYCDFLVHAPALATIAYVPAFAAAAAPIPFDRNRAEPRYAKRVRAAQPRGPPSNLA